MRNTADMIGKLITVWLQSISGMTAVNPLVAFYDIHGKSLPPDTSAVFLIAKQFW
jgi:hypothetical protein